MPKNNDYDFEIEDSDQLSFIDKLVPMCLCKMMPKWYCEASEAPIPECLRNFNRDDED